MGWKERRRGDGDGDRRQIRLDREPGGAHAAAPRPPRKRQGEKAAAEPHLPLLFPLVHPPFLTSSPSHLLSLSGEGEMRFRSLASLLLSLATAARSLSFLSLFLRTALFSLSVASLLAARAGRNACFAGTIHSDTWTARACLAPPSSFVCSIPGITCTQLDPEQQEHLLDILKNSTA